MDLSKSKPKESEITNSCFQFLPRLPAISRNPQCVAHGHEILICGGYQKNQCYSYHTLKNQYKYICSYPSAIVLQAHCVVKCMNNSSADYITLLSFGGKFKHTLIMKYVSVWDNENVIELENTKCVNEWLPFIDNHNQRICIGRKQDNFEGVRAVIGGTENHLLFITYSPRNIDVFNLKRFQYVNYGILPIEERISFHCFLSKSGDVLTTMKTNEKNIEMLLFCRSTGLSIEYNEEGRAFQFQKLQICTALRPLNRYAYVYVNGCIFLFGGNTDFEMHPSNEVHKYSVIKNKWMKFEQTLPSPLSDCVGILSGDSTFLHIIGGQDKKGDIVPLQMKTNISEWMKEQTKMEQLWIKEEEEKKKLKKITMN
ncbi:hypothetical protein RFI_08825 [Reticulomyxa filosa]|uniref:Kelch motif family protein n=1 Tax=Reticulomyxa filosa TaxID=46433 RepID=X6NRF6_RETFI|nr:hypothetical protein RFI_08825 [Reticulomyxa filosa]|eukprot:ETO28309.1 hypothetical protein RFI_08825 [Reticulomyxa filosa]